MQLPGMAHIRPKVNHKASATVRQVAIHFIYCIFRKEDPFVGFLNVSLVNCVAEYYSEILFKKQ